MGYGDNLLGSGFARGAAARGKRIAFGIKGGQTQWDKHSSMVFQGNPNIAKPGTEHQADVEWLDFRKGNRGYNTYDAPNNRWRWNYDFRPVPGEVFFSPHELSQPPFPLRGYIIIEPNVPEWKGSASNKQWSKGRYQQVADELTRRGHTVVQLIHERAHQLTGVKLARSLTFRHALAALKRAKLYIGPEGGLHHGAAAVGIPAVVLFGGFVPPETTGYPTHTNIARGEACGSLGRCAHCRAAMDSIEADEVLAAALAHLESGA